jgi:hypothetical protein
MSFITTGFEIDGALADRDQKVSRQFNAVLARLSGRRVAKLEAYAEPFIRSKMAFKIASFQQPMLYRVVMLASGCASNWNLNNTLCAYLAARALIETVALLREFDWQLEERITKQDFAGMDALLMNRLFATRDEKFTINHKFAEATSVLTIIQKLDKRELPGIWRHYEMLSERCHPNAWVTASSSVCSIPKLV